METQKRERKKETPPEMMETPLFPGIRVTYCCTRYLLSLYLLRVLHLLSYLLHLLLYARTRYLLLLQKYVSYMNEILLP